MGRLVELPRPDIGAIQDAAVQEVLTAWAADLQQAFDDLQTGLEYPYGRPVVVRGARYQAKWGQLVVADTTANNVTVVAPAAARGDFGRAFLVVKFALGNILTVIPPAENQFIDGSTSITIAAAARGSKLIVSVDALNWTEV